jgi:hypothetical protein
MVAQEITKKAEKIRARVQRDTKIYVHNDLSQAATYFNDNIQAKLAEGKRDAIAFDGMACALMIAFAFEANLNFMGSHLLKTGEIKEWKETQSFTKKLDKVFGALEIAIEREKRPLSSMQRMKTLRDTLAHGKPDEKSKDEIVTSKPEDLERGVSLTSDWEKEVKPEVVKECLEDLDTLWKSMIEKSGIDVFDTMTHGGGSITVVDVSPANAT